MYIYRAVKFKIVPMFTEIDILYCVLITGRATKFGLNFGLLCQTFICLTFMLIHVNFTAVAFQYAYLFIIAVHYLDFFE